MNRYDNENLKIIPLQKTQPNGVKKKYLKG